MENEITRFRDRIERQYLDNPTGTGNSFGEILCHVIHQEGQTFLWLAEEWNVSVTFLGEVIADHCVKLEPIEAEQADA